MTENEVAELISKFLSGRATKEEQKRLHDWYDSQDITDKQRVISTPGEVKADIQHRLYSDLIETLRKEAGGNWHRVKKWLPYAAVLFLMLSIGLYVYLNRPFQEKTHYTQLLENDVGPGGNH